MLYINTLELDNDKAAVHAVYNAISTAVNLLRGMGIDLSDAPKGWESVFDVEGVRSYLDGQISLLNNDKPLWSQTSYDDMLSRVHEIQTNLLRKVRPLKARVRPEYLEFTPEGVALAVGWEEAAQERQTHRCAEESEDVWQRVKALAKEVEEIQDLLRNGRNGNRVLVSDNLRERPLLLHLANRYQLLPQNFEGWLPALKVEETEEAAEI